MVADPGCWHARGFSWESTHRMAGWVDSTSAASVWLVSPRTLRGLSQPKCLVRCHRDRTFPRLGLAQLESEPDPCFSQRGGLGVSGDTCRSSFVDSSCASRAWRPCHAKAHGSRDHGCCDCWWHRSGHPVYLLLPESKIRSQPC